MAAASFEQEIPSFESLPDLVKNGLKTVAEAQNFSNYTIECKAGSNVGDGFMGIIMKAVIKGSKVGESDQQELGVLCKIQHLSKARREMSSSYELFEREVVTYRNYLSELEKFQQEKNISKDEGFFNFPKCFYAEVSPVEKEAVIIMEDLREANFAMADKYKPIPIEHLELVVEAVAKLHAVGFSLKDQKPEIYESFTNHKCLISKIITNPVMLGVFHKSLDNAMEMLGDNARLKNKLKYYIKEDFTELFNWLTKDSNAGDYAIVGHGRLIKSNRHKTE